MINYQNENSFSFLGNLRFVDEFLLVEIRKVIMGVFFLPSPNAIRLKIVQTWNSLRLLKDKFKIKTLKASEKKNRSSPIERRTVLSVRQISLREPDTIALAYLPWFIVT